MENMEWTTNKLELQLDTNEIIYQLECMTKEAIELGMTVDDDYIWDALCKVTLDAGLWEETDDDWYEFYQYVVELYKDNWGHEK